MDKSKRPRGEGNFAERVMGNPDTLIKILDCLTPIIAIKYLEEDVSLEQGRKQFLTERYSNIVVGNYPHDKGRKIRRKI